MPVTVGELVVKLEGDTRALRRDLDKASRTISGALRRSLDKTTISARGLVTAFAAVGAASAGIAFLGKKIFDLGASVAETESKFRTVFGNMSDDVEGFIDTFAALQGLSKNQARDLIATTGAIAQGMGFAQQESAQFAKAVTELSADIGSFNNLPTEEVAQRIQAALTGERESLKRLGIVILETEVQQRSLLNTGKTHISQITQQDKATASLQIITERAGVAIGDLARTQDSAANQARKVGAEFRNIAEDFSAQLLPVLVDMIPMFQDLAAAAAEAVPRVVKFITTLLDLAGLSNAALREELRTFKELDAEGKRGHVERLTRERAIKIATLATAEALEEVAKKQGSFNDAMAASTAVGEAKADLDELTIVLDFLATQVERLERTVIPESPLAKLVPSAVVARIERFNMALQGIQRGVADTTGGPAAITPRVPGIPGDAFGRAVLVQRMKDQIADEQAKLDEFLVRTGDDIARTFGDQMTDAGIFAGESLIRGIIAGSDSLGDLLKNSLKQLIATSIIGVFSKVLKFGSPSRVFVGFGQNIVRGLQIGMRSVMADLAETSTALAHVSARPVAAVAGGGPSNLNVDFLNMPQPLTPGEASLNAGWQELFRETFLQLENGGFRG